MTTQAPLKQTPLHDVHVAAGAKLVDFAGWDMPLQYARIVQEHQAVRQRAGVFDISHMGLVSVSAPALSATTAFLDRLFPQDIARLQPGKAVYTQFLTEQGTMVDDVIVYRLPELSQAFDGFSQYLVIVNASNREKDMAWMREQAHAAGVPDIAISLLSDRYGLIALQGPESLAVLAQLGLAAESVPKRFWVTESRLAGLPALVARTGYTGEDGVELVASATDLPQLWQRLVALGVQPAGLGARDMLRLEAGLPLYGHDISDADTPLEAGLGWSVKLNKPSDFIGKRALLAQQAAGVPKRLIGFILGKKTIARQHDPIVFDGRVVGEVTSGSLSPVLDQSIGMGYVISAVPVEPGTALEVEVRGQRVPAQLVTLPFYKKGAGPS